MKTTDEITRQQQLDRLDRLEAEVAELMTLARQLAARYGAEAEGTTGVEVFGMTATEATTPKAPSLAFQIEDGIHKAGHLAGNAVDQMFQNLADAGWRWEGVPGDDHPMPVHADLGERLEYKASMAIREQLSNAVLAFWLDLRRTCQVEFGSQESIGTLVEQLAGVAASLVFDAGQLPPATMHNEPSKDVDSTDTLTSAEVAALRAEVAELRRQVDAALASVRSLPRPAQNDEVSG